MARTRVVVHRRPNINFDLRRVAAAKEIANRRRTRSNNIKIKFLLPQGKDVEVKQRGVVVRKMRVRRKAIFRELLDKSDINKNIFITLVAITTN